jgi:hypothetical protein
MFGGSPQRTAIWQKIPCSSSLPQQQHYCVFGVFTCYAAGAQPVLVRLVRQRVTLNMVTMLTLQILPYWLLAFANVPEVWRGRIGVTLVFAFEPSRGFAVTT